MCRDAVGLDDPHFLEVLLHPVFLPVRPLYHCMYLSMTGPFHVLPRCLAHRPEPVILLGLRRRGEFDAFRVERTDSITKIPSVTST